MFNFIKKEVLFADYCPKCKCKGLTETEDPCNECLTCGYNYFSHKPVKFKEVR